MSTSKRPLEGPRRFQWNAGGWFGSSVGGSAWMIVAAAFLIFHDQPLLALVPTVGFAIILLASVLLWARRDRLYPFTAMMILLTLLAVAIPVVWVAVASYASPAALATMNWPVSIWPTVLAILIAPALMLWFMILERSAKPNGQTKSPDSKPVA